MRTLLTVSAAGALLVPASVIPAGAAHAVDPIPNPRLEPISCGLDTTLVLDASGSIPQYNAEEDVRRAARGFINALLDTKSSVRMTQFSTFTGLLAPRTLVTPESVAAGGTLSDGLDNYLNPRPELPDGASVWNYRSGDWTLPSSWRDVTPQGLTFTNWQAALKQAGNEDRAPELLVFVTDGDPTSMNLSQPDDPHHGNGKNVGVNTDRGTAGTPTINRAVSEANDAKRAGSRILAVGVGPEVTTPGSASVERLTKVSGTRIATSLQDADNINQVDVALVKDFNDLDNFLRRVATELCTPSVTIRKFAQTTANGPYEPASGWRMTTTPTVSGGFSWVLPNTSGGKSKSESTDRDGFAQFQWTPDKSQASSEVEIVEEVRSGFTAGRPGADNDWICEKRNSKNADVTEVKGDFANPQSPSIDLKVAYNQLVTCSVFNSVAGPGPDPTPTPTPSPTPPREPAPIKVDAVNTTTYTPNVYETLVRSSSTKPKVKLTYRTKCRPVVAASVGEVTYCKTRVGKNGKVQVKVIGNQKVRVKQFIVATPVGKGAEKYKRSSWTRTWTLSPK